MYEYAGILVSISYCMYVRTYVCSVDCVGGEGKYVTANLITQLAMDLHNYLMYILTQCIQK